MSHIECELVERIRISRGFAMKADVSTELDGLSFSLAFVRYISAGMRKCLCS